MMAPGMGPGPFHDKTQAAVMITILRTMMTIAFFFFYFPLLPRLQPPQAGPLQISQQRFTASVTWNKWN